MSIDAAGKDDAGKQPLNLLVLISELYNFQVISCRIVYDIVRGLIDALAMQGPAGEFAVEALLKIVRSRWRALAFLQTGIPAGDLCFFCVHRLRSPIAFG